MSLDLTTLLWLGLGIIFGVLVGSRLRAVERPAHRLPTAPASGTSATASFAPEKREKLDEVVRELLRQGMKIQAIKVWREATGLGLKESKDAVDAIEREMGL